MKKLLLLLLLVVATGTAVAQTGYVRSQALLIAMPETAPAQKKMDETRQRLERDMQGADAKAQEQYQRLQFKAKDPDLDEAKRIALQEEFRTLQSELANLEANSKRELYELEQKLMGPITKKLSDAIEKVAKKRGFKIVVDMASVVYAEEGQDISLDVSKELGIAVEE